MVISWFTLGGRRAAKIRAPSGQRTLLESGGCQCAGGRSRKYYWAADLGHPVGSAMALDFGDLVTVDAAVALANEFARTKDEALVREAGGCAIYLFTESCHAHHGASCWAMEANKLWRACVKKAKARRRSSANRGGCGDESFLAEELRKAAHRLVPPGSFGPAGKRSRIAKRRRRSSTNPSTYVSAMTRFA